MAGDVLERGRAHRRERGAGCRQAAAAGGGAQRGQRRAGGDPPPDRDRGIDPLDHSREEVDELALQGLVEGEPAVGGVVVRDRDHGPLGLGVAELGDHVPGRLAPPDRPPHRPDAVRDLVGDRRRGHRPAGDPERAPAPGERGQPGGRPGRRHPGEQVGVPVEELLLVDRDGGAGRLEAGGQPPRCLALALRACLALERRQRLDHLAQGLERGPGGGVGGQRGVGRGHQSAAGYRRPRPGRAATGPTGRRAGRRRRSGSRSAGSRAAGPGPRSRGPAG